MRKSTPVAGLLAVAAVLLAACGGATDSFSPPRSTDTSDLNAAEGPTTLVRFVVLTPPGFGPINLVDSNDPKRTFATGLTPGTVTDYLRVPVEVEAVDATGKPLEGMLSGTSDSAPRNTMVIGAKDTDGGPEYFKERNGQVVIDPEAFGGTLPTDQPVLISTNTGVADLPSALVMVLGSGSGKCLSGAIRGNDGQIPGPGQVGWGSIPSFYVPQAGAGQLSWYSDTGCTVADTASADFTLGNGQSAYVLPWEADKTHLRFLFVPITTDKPGNYGVINAPAGPAWQLDPCQVTMCVDGSAIPAPDGSGSDAPDPDNSDQGTADPDSPDTDTADADTADPRDG